MTTVAGGTGKLQGKVAIVTGAAQGMGAAEATQFAREGARVVLADILDEAGQRLAEELGDLAEYRSHDVSDEASWTDLVGYVASTHGGVDVLVNNAGVVRGGALDEIPLEDIDLMYRVNQLGVLLGMRAVAAPMRRTSAGSIINVASGAALRGLPGLVGYSATKFAVRGMTKVAALELAPFAVRVNNIHPGLIDTPMRHALSDEAKATDPPVPMGRLGDASEVAELATFLASDASSYITGGDFVIDGGVIL